MDARIKNAILSVQRTEITEHHIYLKLAERCRDSNNAEVLRNIAGQELEHSRFWQSKTGVDV
jgi:rubrerythrin